MYRLRSVISLLLLLLVLSPTAFSNTATEPVPGKSPTWMERHDRMNQRVKQGNVDLLWIGDSIVANWTDPERGKSVWDEYYADRNAVNLGIGGDCTEHVLWRLDHGNIDGINPKLAIVMIGQNNGPHNTGEEIGEGVTAVVQRLRNKLPNTKVLLLAIFPRREKPTEERAVLAKANDIASKLADGKNVFYLDVNYVFLQPDGSLPASLMPDFEHPNTKGHRLWAEAIEPNVAALMGEVAAGKAPKGYTPLFNGKDLAGWKGLVDDPEKRAKLTPEQLAAAQATADQRMRDHWHVVDGALEFDGKGDSLCTAKDYADFDMTVDWKIKDEGDSGIYLRGSPQVQIWDPKKSKIGSGGLYNNQKGPHDPLVLADNPIGEWNSFRLKMIGEKVTVWLNDKLVVDNVVLENYWDRSKPIYPSGQIELQNHGNNLWFRNVFIREIPKDQN